MSATELDVPVLFSSEQIRRREFVTIRRGYDPHQVRDYLEQLADQVELMASMLRETRLEAEAAMREIAQPKVDPYERLANRVVSVIREADDVAERVQIESRRESERMLQEARADAERIRSEARAKDERARENAKRSLRMAKETADRTLSGLSTRRHRLVGELTQMRERLLVVARDLEATIVMPEIEEDDVESSNGASDGDAVESVVDVTNGQAASLPRRIDVSDDSIEDSMDDSIDDPEMFEDPSYAELWEGTKALDLDMPDIPRLELFWDDGSDDAPRD